MTVPVLTTLSISDVSAMECVQDAGKVSVVGCTHLMMVIVGLWRAEPGKVKARVVVDLMEGDDEVPEPGGREVRPNQNWTKRNRQNTV